MFQMSEGVSIELLSNLVRGAQFNYDKTRRYYLWRRWDARKPTVTFIGLNPSTADAMNDDPTIRKIAAIAKHNCYGGIYMVNLFTLVSPYPEALKTEGGATQWSIDAQWIKTMAEVSKDVVFAWGNFEIAVDRGLEVAEMFDQPLCLKQNKNGSPKHPLYCRSASLLYRFDTKKLKR